MSKTERLHDILDFLKKKKYAGVQELSHALYASQPTIRRDLTQLENAGYVIRSHGGVILRDERVDTPVAFRSSTQTQQKMQISRIAADLIREGQTVFLDASTTASFMTEAIKKTDRLTVVTNSLRVAEKLADAAPTVWCTGGQLLRTSLAFVGHQSIRCVSDFCIDLAFFSSSALGTDGIIKDYSSEETEIRRVVLRSAAAKVFLCDSSKFGRISPFRVCGLDDIDCIITDAPIPPEIRFSSLFTEKDCGGGYLYFRSAAVPKQKTDRQEP